MVCADRGHLGQTSVPVERVAFLDSAPEGKSYRVVGYVYPPSFRTWGEKLNATRAAASPYGVDAVFLEVWNEIEGWGAQLASGDAFAGRWKKVAVRAQAIVWD